MSQIVQMSFLSEKEEETILSVVEEDLKIQKEEEKRVQKLRDDIASLTVKCRNYTRTFCACCGVLFGWIFDSGKMCPACSHWICKRDRIHFSDTNQWICKLCNFQMELYINEQMLSVSLDPSNVLCVSFNTRDSETEQGFHYKQQNYLQPKEETEQGYHNQEMFQQETGEESEEDKKDNGDDEEQQPQQNTHTPAAKCVNSNLQETCQQNHQKEKEADQTQQQQQQSLEVQPVTGRHSQSPKKLMFRERSSIIRPKTPASIYHTVNPIDTLDDGDNDDGFTEITADSDDSLDSSSSCSVEDDGETSDDDDVQKRNTCNQLKPILVYPSSTDDVKETINLTFPQKSEEKSYMKLDDYDFRALTKENTLRNRANITSSLRSLLDYDDDRVYKTDSLNSSMSDMQSICSESVIYTHNDITGQIQMSVSYSDTDNTLKVSINKVQGLTPPNKIDENHTNPYVKTYLLPDQSKSTKKKTSVKKGVDPIFNETIKYPIKRQELSKHTLKVGVWHNGFWRHNLFLGEVTLPLDKVDWSNPSDKWYGLEELSPSQLTSVKTTIKTLPTDGLDTDNNSMVVCSSRQLVDTPVHIGQVRVMLQYVPAVADTSKSGKEKCYLKVWIRQASGLKTRYDNGSFVLCTLLPKGKHQKLKSPVTHDQNDENVLYSAKFQFNKVTDVELSYDRVLEITIWEPHRNTNEFVGGIRLGPKPQPGNKNKWMDCVGSEVSQWETMIARPKEWIDEWHPLRSLNKPQKV